MNQEQIVNLYRCMLAAREVDRVEQELTRRGEAFFHVSGAGHEATATLALHLGRQDWLNCHYRDKALMLARGVPARAFFDAVYCNRASHSGGRQMCAHMSDRERNIVTMAGPVGNAALHAVGQAAALKQNADRPIVLLSAGEGTTQEGEYLEAIAEAVRAQLPVLFLIQDNRWAISTRTCHQTLYSYPDHEAEQFYGLPVRRIDGRNALQSSAEFAAIVAEIRDRRGPALVVFDVERLSSHTNADDETLYREQADIDRAASTGDPIRMLEQHLLLAGLSESELESIRGEVSREVTAAEEESAASGDPEPNFSARPPIRIELTHPARETIPPVGDSRRLVMKDAMRDVLRDRLANDSRVFIWGQDLEDPKGDVFGVTKGLSTDFPGRVVNSPLSESTILGGAIGRAQAGQRPVAFLQFADFLPLAYNQIVNDLGSMFWRTNGDWQSPVIVMVPCGGYRPGLGPFHSHSLESVMAHVPGVDVFMPSNAADAAGLLNAAFQSERPSLFFYPKACLNDPQRATSSNVSEHFVPIGPARKLRSGRDVTLVGWGNTVRLCENVAETLESAGVEAEVLDLRTISPWDVHSVVSSAEKTAHLVVVHEDNHTCGVGAEVLATVAEKARVPVAMRRVTRPDTYIPCNFANQLEVLPSYKRLLTTVAELLNMSLTWSAPEEVAEGTAFVEAIGSGPSDETVIIAELLVQEGDSIERGDVVASLEATKSVFELNSQHSGTVEEILVAEGETVDVGEPILKLSVAADTRRVKPVTQEAPGTPTLAHKPSPLRVTSNREGEPRKFKVGISSVSSVEGSRVITNEQLLSKAKSNMNGMTVNDIFRRTGIESRRWIDPGEDAIGMAVKASWKVLDEQNLLPDDLDLVICSTTSPLGVTPSMACRVLNGLAGANTDAMIQAYDISAACSGYLYALQAGYDFLQSMPGGRVLVVTAEVLSPLLNLEDFDTSILFGDACSATILYGEDHLDKSAGTLFRPELSAKCDTDGSLSVPLPDGGHIQMNGRKVFSEAVRSMLTSLTRVCQREGINVDDLNMVVPHQANQRIIDAISHRIRVPVFSNIRQHGNTSSTTIPLCLTEVLPAAAHGERFGLCAFGGGFTFGASIVEAN